MAPPDKDLEWSQEGLEGAYRFLGRVWRYVAEVAERTADAGRGGGGDQSANATLLRERHRVVGKVTEDVERFQFNTALAAMMELLNAAGDYRRAVPDNARDAALEREVAETLVLLLAPYAPHMCEELWREMLGHDRSVHRETWPAYDASLAVADEVEIVVQVNGKVRGRVVLDASASDEEIRSAALALPRIMEQTEGRTIQKVVVVPGKLVSIVVK